MRRIRSFLFLQSHIDNPKKLYKQKNNRINKSLPSFSCLPNCRFWSYDLYEPAIYGSGLFIEYSAMELGTNNKKSKMADETEGKSSKSSHLVKKHHEKAKACYSRPSYRDPRWEKAVKVNFSVDLTFVRMFLAGSILERSVHVFTSFSLLFIYCRCTPLIWNRNIF